MSQRDDLDWMLDGDCNQTDPEAFFPEKGQRAEGAQRVCARCPVKAICREYGIVNARELDGIWGGLSQRLRKRALREREAYGNPALAQPA